MQALQKEGRAPALIVLENVCGALASHNGKDFAAIGAALAKHYRFGAVVMDAVRFVPQSRPRLFILAVRNDRAVPAERTAANPDSVWHPSHLVNAYEKLSASAHEAWIWWRLPAPVPRSTVFSDLIEDEPQGVAWHTASETRRLLSMMSPINRRKVAQAKQLGRRRSEESTGARAWMKTASACSAPRCASTRSRVACARLWEAPAGKLSLSSNPTNPLAFALPARSGALDGIAGCLHPAKNYNEAYHLAGDGVVVPVVRFLAAICWSPCSRPRNASRKRRDGARPPG